VNKISICCPQFRGDYVMVAQELKKEITKTTVSLSPSGDIMGHWKFFNVEKAVDNPT